MAYWLNSGVEKPEQSINILLMDIFKLCYPYRGIFGSFFKKINKICIDFF